MKDFKKYYILQAEPEIVYQALTTEATIRLWTGDLVQFTPEVGTEFSLWDGSIVGKNLTLEPPHKIEQEWYFGEQEKPSIVTLKLHEHNRGTSLEVRHINIPDEAYDDIVDGWDNIYMSSLIDFYTEE